MHLTTALDGSKTSYVLELISEETEKLLRTRFSDPSALALADFFFHTRILLVLFNY
jgi:hypothetical protein